MKIKAVLILAVSFACLLFGCARTSPSVPPNTLPPSVMIDGVLYYYTGHAVSAEIDESSIMGTITSTVSLTEMPAENGQSNMAPSGCPYAQYEENYVVLMEEKWMLFESRDKDAPSPGHIYLYGEAHGVKKILDKEFELWHDYYHNENMRHLFVEQPYYTAAFLNIWMQSDGDDILDEIYRDWDGTQSQNPDIKAFYQKIKNECPETVFHGTDIGHQFNTTGERYVKYLKDNNLKASDQYLLALEAIEQGARYYKKSDHVYRENRMTENFIREYDKLSGTDIMGIYGSAHTGLDAMDFYGDVPCMANQLKAHYGDAVHSEDLTWLSNEPIRVDSINVNGNEYEASYFGKQDMTTWSNEYVFREFWRLENAYNDFKDNAKTGNVLPYNNYPIPIVEGEVFVTDCTKTDGSVVRMYYRSDGFIWNGMPSTEEFTVKCA